MTWPGTEDSPVIEDLAAHDVPPNTPAVLITLVAHPIVAEDLGVEVVRLKRGVVDMGSSRSFKEEEAVVVDQLIPAVQSKEHGVVLSVLVNQL